jgi:carbon monoxide dehydrogenase subunit G
MGAFNWREDGRERAVGAAPSQAVVSRARHIAAPPDAVFAVLARPEGLAGVLPRVKKVEVLEQGASQARIVTHMQLTPFNTIRAEGEVRWQGTREIVFRTTQPAGVETRLELRPTASGTNLYATLALDLAPMLGPLAAFVPHEQVAKAAGPDLDNTIDAIARAVERGEASA